MSEILSFSNRFLFKTEDLQNISLFMIAIGSFISCLVYNLQEGIGDITPFEILMKFVTVHALIDIFLTKSLDLKLHHLSIFGILFYNHFFQVLPEHRFLFMYPLLKTEISSIFYVLKYWLPKKSVLYPVNMLLFYLSFFKYRICDFYYEIIHNNTSIRVVYQIYSHSNPLMTILFVASCYGLYILNMYWFMVMTKILYKNVTKLVFDTDKLCHLLCSFTQFANTFLSIFIHSYNPHEKYILEVMGIGILSLSSYQYHFDIWNRLDENKITEYIVPTKENVVYFIHDSLAIGLRGFSIVATNYYESPMFQYALIISGMFHAASIYHCYNNLLELFMDHEKSKESFYICHYIILALPLGCDAVLVLMNAPTETAIPFLLVNIAIGLLFVVEPFYKMNHFAFHLLLIAQQNLLPIRETKVSYP